METRNCQNCKKDFVIEEEDFSFYKKIQVPTPTFCAECRFQRRAMFRNDRNLFRVKSGKSGKPILSLFPPESEVVVYTESEWWADDWDALSYGKPYDFKKDFFSQLNDLSKVVPKYNLDVIRMVNSDYSGNASDLKNCYLLFNSNRSEDCMYGTAVDSSRVCIDNSYVVGSERSYENIFVNSSYRTHFSLDCAECNEVLFSKNCRGCQNCIGCVNLRNKNYYIFNQPYSKEEYEKTVQEFSLDTYSGLTNFKEKAYAFWKNFPNKFQSGVKNNNATGVYVTESKNVKNGYLVTGGEDLRYCQYVQVPSNRECYDIMVWGFNNELCYENCVCGENVYNVKFSLECWPNVSDLEYCQYCKSCSDCFGCVGLRNKKYCIFNVQYSKEEYFEIKEKIKKHMDEMPYVSKNGCIYKYGEFIPAEFSPYGYNNSIANEHIELSMDEAIRNGFPWIESPKSEYQISMKASELPDSVKDATDDVLNQTIECTQTGRAYRIMKEELEFLRRENLPLPRVSVDVRHKDRLSFRLKNKTYKRECDCGGEFSKDSKYENSGKHAFHEGFCKNEFITGYNSKDGDIVYCEQCYQQEVS